MGKQGQSREESTNKEYGRQGKYAKGNHGGGSGGGNTRTAVGGDYGDDRGDDSGYLQSPAQAVYSRNASFMDGYDPQGYIREKRTNVGPYSQDTGWTWGDRKPER